MPPMFKPSMICTFILYCLHSSHILDPHIMIFPLIDTNQVRYKTNIWRSSPKSFTIFVPKTGPHFWQQYAACARRRSRFARQPFAFPAFSPQVLSLSCPNGNFSMDRIYDASLHAPTHHPTGPPYIKVRHIFLELAFFGRFILTPGQK